MTDPKVQEGEMQPPPKNLILKTLEKQVKQRFSIRIGKWELVFWEITYEAPKAVEEIRQ